jgi:hypothetical protein
MAMKKRTKVKIAHGLTRLVKPCHFYESVNTPKGEKLQCGYDHTRRNRCKTVNCPHFVPTTRYKIARRLGMVK